MFDTFVILAAIALSTLYLQRKLAMATMTLEQLQTALQEQTEQVTTMRDIVTKIGDETTALLAKVDELQEVINNADGVPEEIVALVASLQANTAALKSGLVMIDDKVPDAETPPAS